MEAADLVLTDSKAEGAADELLAAMSELAYSTPKAEIEIEKKHRSSFFFQPSVSLEKEIKARSAKLKKKMHHIDDNIVARLKLYKSEIPPRLAENIDVVREFFLTEIGPRTLAGGGGASQAKDIVQRLLGTEIDNSQFDKFERMSHAAVNLVMAKFVAKYYGLPANAADSILSAITPRPQISVPIPPYEPRHATKAANKNQEQSIAKRPVP